MSEINPDAANLPRQNPWAVLNKISIAEWLRAHGKFVRPELTKKQRLELKECFELIDADGSGAISSSEMLTAFHVLGIRTKISEVEEMLSEVDADGSGEVEYPEFVQIMTTKMDSQTQEDEPRASKPGKSQPLPFPLLAQAYRRKKLMEAVMQGDKATQERLQARAEEMEQERIAAIAEVEAQRNQVKKKPKTLSQITKERIRKAAKLKKKEADLPLPGYILENIDEDVKQVLFGVHERASLRRSSMSQTEKENMVKEKARKEKERRMSAAIAEVTSDPTKLILAAQLSDVIEVTPDPGPLKAAIGPSDVTGVTPDPPALKPATESSNAAAEVIPDPYTPKPATESSNIANVIPGPRRLKPAVYFSNTAEVIPDPHTMQSATDSSNKAELTPDFHKLKPATDSFNKVDVTPDFHKLMPATDSSNIPEVTPDPEAAVSGKEVKRFTISNLEGRQMAQLSKQMQAYYKQELSAVRAGRSKQLRDKPTLEQQKIKLRAVQSVGTYYQHDEKQETWDLRGSPTLMVDPAERERINTPWRVPSRNKLRAPSRNVSHARIFYVPPPKPVKNFQEDKRPDWISHLHLRR